MSAASSFVDESFSGKTPQETVNALLNEFEAFLKEFPEYTGFWYVDINTEVIYDTDALATVKLETESYTGGAHGNATTQYYIFNK